MKKLKQIFYKYWIQPWWPLILLIAPIYADDNHIHIEQVNGGDNVNLTIDQLGYNNLIKFSLKAWLQTPKFD